MPTIPPFSDLPLKKDGPRLNAWGLYGPNDELGTLNRLTPETTLEAKNEIRTGVRIGLDAPLDVMGPSPLFGRQAFLQEVKSKAPRAGNDDVWTFNTQCSSQWDGLRHFGYANEKVFYNGVTMEQIHAKHEGKPASTINGVQAWVEQGIVGRGVLVDYHSWRTANKVEYDAFESSSIPLKDIKAVLESQGTELKFGDILILRTGYTVAFKQQDASRLKELSSREVEKYGGLEQSEEMAEWIWNHFAAVAGDHPALECWPTPKEWRLHEVLLSGWGCPIGELFDLERLAAYCQQQKRWTFFFTSQVNHVPGGVASPPNALAIF